MFHKSKLKVRIFSESLHIDVCIIYGTSTASPQSGSAAAGEDDFFSIPLDGSEKIKSSQAYNSPKVCEVNYARVQGLEANIEVYRNSPVNGIPIKQYRPLIFHNGEEVEFPSPDAPLPPIQLRSEE